MQVVYYYMTRTMRMAQVVRVKPVQYHRQEENGKGCPQPFPFSFPHSPCHFSKGSVRRPCDRVGHSGRSEPLYAERSFRDGVRRKRALLKDDGGECTFDEASDSSDCCQGYGGAAGVPAGVVKLAARTRRLVTELINLVEPVREGVRPGGGG